MQDSMLYPIMYISLIILIISLEWDKIKKADTKKLMIYLTILFLLGSPLIYLFIY